MLRECAVEAIEITAAVLMLLSETILRADLLTLSLLGASVDDFTRLARARGEVQAHKWRVAILSQAEAEH